MRIEFFVPDLPAGQLIPIEILCDVLELAGSCPHCVETMEAWTRFERIVAYDWAMREHLAASDRAIRRRGRPAFLDAD